MTGRDRMVVIAIGVFLILGVCWLMVVSPERKQAAALQTQVGAANTQLATAQSQVSSAQGAQAQYAAAYASIVSLGKAVPPTPEVPSLIYQIAQASNQKSVEFSSITAGGGASAAAPTSTTAAAGVSELPFSFVFNGTYLALYHLLQQLDHFTVRTTSGGLSVTGRLLTIQSVKLAPAGASGPAAGKSQEESLTGTITATAYVLPAAQAPAGAATAGTPAASAAAPSTASSGAASSPTAPAVAKVTP